MHSNTFFKNTLIVLSTNFIIKILGLLNKIIITRLLGQVGMGLYVLTMPTILLLTSISSLSLNSVISKLVSENLVRKVYSFKKLLISSILLSLSVSGILIFVLLISCRFLTNNLLNNANLFFPIISSIFLIPLVGISDALRGYFNGLKIMKYSSTSTLIEQASRITSTIILIFVTIKYSIILSVSMCVIGLCIGEIASIIYTLIKIKKQNIEEYDNTSGEIKAILKEAIPNTLSRLITSGTHFLEPIIYTNILLLLNYNNESINYSYTIISAYVIPFITLTSFVSNSVSTSIIPGISENYQKNNFKAIHYYIDRSISFSLIPGLFSCIIFYLFSSEYLTLLFDTTEGINIIKYTVFLSLPYYLQMPFTSILQAIGKNRFLFITTIILDSLKLLFIIFFSFIPSIGLNSIIASVLIIILIDIIVMFIKIKKTTKYSINVDEIISIVLIFFFTFTLTYFLKLFNINFIIITFISLFVTLYLIYRFNFLNKDLFKKQK